MLCRFRSWHYAGCANISGASSEQSRPSESGVAHHRNTESGHCSNRMGVESALDHRQLQLSERQKGKVATHARGAQAQVSCTHGNFKCPKVNRIWLIFVVLFRLAPPSTGVWKINTKMCARHWTGRLAGESIGHRSHSNAGGRNVASHTGGRCFSPWSVCVTVNLHGGGGRPQIHQTFDSPDLMLFHSRAQLTKSNRSKINAFFIASKWTKMVRQVHHNRTKWMRPTSTCVKDWAHYCIVARTQRFAWFCENRKCGAENREHLYKKHSRVKMNGFANEQAI